MSFKIRQPRYIPLVDHGEGNTIVQPILAETFGILSGNRQCIVLPGEEAIEGEAGFKGISRINNARLDPFDARVGAKDVDAQAIPDQYADDRILKFALSRGPGRES